MRVVVAGAVVVGVVAVAPPARMKRPFQLAELDGA